MHVQHCPAEKFQSLKDMSCPRFNFENSMNIQNSTHAYGDQEKSFNEEMEVKEISSDCPIKN